MVGTPPVSWRDYSELTTRKKEKKMRDLYFDERYGKLYEEIEKGVCQLFEFNHPFGRVRHMFIKRMIPILIGPNRYYDIITPYGYGGPMMTDCTTENRQELGEAFEKAFAAYCDSENIVSEFIRFHPVHCNAEDFKAIYEVNYLRDTVGTSIRVHDDPIQAEFSSSARKNIRKALRDGIEYRVTLAPSDLRAFQQIYFATMERNRAESFYYFNEQYFNQLLESFGERLLLVEALYKGEVIGMELQFVDNDIIHTHLSGTYEAFHHLSPVYIMQYATVLWAKERGISLIHGGGGRTNSPDDNLLRFKRQFARCTSFSFYTGQKVWNEDMYNQLCKIANTEITDEFFPAYRKLQENDTNKVSKFNSDESEMEI
ncbi:GNAT family N-acetyltransferase [Planococcus dechangensis]|uniref:Lipid II:glycine glycyltransferase n=1 Tax=Planococcus dechangensis TaxID=1176255 RepID=A0ABV9MDW6_9BACL